MSRRIWTGRVLPTLGLLVALAGFGVSIYLSVNQPPAATGPGGSGPAEIGSESSGAESTGAESSRPAAPPGSSLTSADFPATSPEVGHQVGYQIPDFTLELVDGAAIASADLVAAERPAFLFFFATT